MPTNPSMHSTNTTPNRNQYPSPSRSANTFSNPFLPLDQGSTTNQDAVIENKVFSMLNQYFAAGAQNSQIQQQQQHQ